MDSTHAIWGTAAFSTLLANNPDLTFDVVTSEYGGSVVAIFPKWPNIHHEDALDLYNALIKIKSFYTLSSWGYPNLETRYEDSYMSKAKTFWSYRTKYRLLRREFLGFIRAVAANVRDNSKNYHTQESSIAYMREVITQLNGELFDTKNQLEKANQQIIKLTASGIILANEVGKEGE